MCEAPSQNPPLLNFEHPHPDLERGTIEKSDSASDARAIGQKDGFRTFGRRGQGILGISEDGRAATSDAIRRDLPTEVGVAHLAARADREFCGDEFRPHKFTSPHAHAWQSMNFQDWCRYARPSEMRGWGCTMCRSLAGRVRGHNMDVGHILPLRLACGRRWGCARSLLSR